MKGLLTVLFAFVFTMACTSLYAAESTSQTAGKTVMESVVSQDIPDPDIDCGTFDCPVSEILNFHGCVEVDNCKAIPDDRIKQIINNFVRRICNRLRECCRINGCEEFACELLESSHACTDDNTKLCVRVRIAFKCQ